MDTAAYVPNCGMINNEKLPARAHRQLHSVCCLPTPTPHQGDVLFLSTQGGTPIVCKGGKEIEFMEVLIYIQGTLLDFRVGNKD